MDDQHGHGCPPCAVCGGPYRSDRSRVEDPLYLTSSGVCFECHVFQFYERHKPQRGRYALARWHIAQGYTQAEAAAMAGMSRRGAQEKIHDERILSAQKGRVDRLEGENHD